MAKSVVPVTEIIESSGEPLIQGEGIVEFRLLYSGKLCKEDGPEGKHWIRRQFHPQLRELWSSHRTLQEWAERLGSTRPDAISTATPDEHRKAGIEEIADDWNRAGFRFVPLITKETCLRCSLDILLLRREQPGRIYMKGDIDGRVKTIFDALRMADNVSETADLFPKSVKTHSTCCWKTTIRFPK